MDRRITLVNSIGRSRDWCLGDDAPSRIVFGSFFKIIRHTFNGEIHELGEDIERVIIDRTASAAEFLELLAHLADDFVFNVILIHDGETAYLSASGRGGGRLLYALRGEDVRF